MHHANRNERRRDQVLHSEELKRQTLNGRQTLRPDSTTGITVLPAWMDAPEDEGLYDDLVCAALNSSEQNEDGQ